jgi:hypothetical protein
MDGSKLELDNLAPEDVLEELKGYYTERMFAHRWIKIETYHEIGKAILEGKVGIDTVMEATKSSRKTVETWIAFAKEFKTVEESPFTKNQSWEDIKERYAPKPKRESFRIGDLKKILNNRKIDNFNIGRKQASDEDEAILGIIENKGR